MQQTIRDVAKFTRNSQGKKNDALGLQEARAAPSWTQNEAEKQTPPRAHPCVHRTSQLAVGITTPAVFGSPKCGDKIKVVA
jgi:hypothetical protein